MPGLNLKLLDELLDGLEKIFKLKKGQTIRISFSNEKMTLKRID